jgi:hypothetical protein
MLAAVWLAPAALASARVYWSDVDSNAIRVANVNGTGSPQTLFRGGIGPAGVAIAPAAGKIYWAIFGTERGGSIEVANLDGTGSPDDCFRGENAPTGVAIDSTAGKIYWADVDGDAIRVANLDDCGSASDLFKAEVAPWAPFGVAIDPAAGKIYWSDVNSDEVRVANLDGSGSPANLFTGEHATGVAIDPAANKIYWADSGRDAIRVANLDGSGSPANLFTGEHASGVAIDPAANKIYWADAHGGAIRVANLDGSDSPADLFTGESSPGFVALLRAPAGTGAPSISGSGQVGQQLSCSQGSWAADLEGSFLYRAPRWFAYQWQLGGSDIAGANQATYTATAAGSYTCRVKASNEAGSNSQTSAPVIVTNLSTNASAGVLLGGSIHDTATVRGGRSPTGRITFALYGPGDSDCSGSPAFTSVTTISGNGDSGSDAFTPTAAGTYRWTASYSGDSDNSPASSPCNAADESVRVSQAAPLMTTNASADVVLGGSVNDTATLTGGPSPSGTITFKVYGPDDSSCSGSAVFTDTKAVSGNGDYKSADFTTTTPGTYRWIASYSGDSDDQPSTGVCNEGGESVVVSGPAVTNLHLVPDHFKANQKPTPLGPPTPKRSTGTEIRFHLNAAALVHFAIRRVPRRPNPDGPDVPHAFNRNLDAGAQSVAFTGTLAHHTLHPGNYMLYARAIDTVTGFRSPKVSAKFTVLGG